MPELQSAYSLMIKTSPGLYQCKDAPESEMHRSQGTKRCELFLFRIAHQFERKKHESRKDKLPF